MLDFIKVEVFAASYEINLENMETLPAEPLKIL